MESSPQESESDLWREKEEEKKGKEEKSQKEERGVFIPESIGSRLIKLAYYGAGEQFRRLLEREVDHGLEIESIHDKRDFSLLHVFTQTQ